MPSLYEDYRPNSWNYLVGQDATIKKLTALSKRGLGGRVFWITGGSGVGKTTVARLIAADVADAYAVIELDAQDLSMDKVREFEKMCRFKPLGKGWHVFIVNEAHGLSKKVLSRLQTLFEAPHVQSNSTWVFTTTPQGEGRLFDINIDAAPFISRTIELELNSGESVLEPFAERAQLIASLEDLDGLPRSAYRDLVTRCGFNMRKTLQEIESGAMVA